jgi:hypothetical protein
MNTGKRQVLYRDALGTSDKIVRVRLDEKEFRQLVAGKVVRLESAKGEIVEMILADIGWDRMEFALTDAVMGKEP